MYCVGKFEDFCPKLISDVACMQAPTVRGISSLVNKVTTRHTVSLRHHLGPDGGRVLGSALPRLRDGGGIEPSRTHTFYVSIPTDGKAFMNL